MQSSVEPTGALIKGRVATVLNPRQGIDLTKQQLAINVGSKKGVKHGMQFDVMEDEVQVSDPETGEALGVVSARKGRVRVTAVHDRFSIATVIESPDSLLQLSKLFPTIDSLEVGDRVVEVRPGK
ncbi:MAG: hypothetical protein OXG83_14920 [Acidobacteria bacterium]|nr:hypothetical protein [Acidobacteriota bacterium]